MNITRRTALVLSLTSLLGLGGTAAVAGLVLDDAFQELEEDDARRDLERVQAAVDADLARMAWVAARLGDPAPAALGNGTGDDRQAADAVAALARSADVDALALRQDGAWVVWRLDKTRLPAGLDAALTPSPSLSSAVAASGLAAPDPAHPAHALLGSGGDAYLAGAHADGSGAAVVALRLVDDEYNRLLASATGLRVELRPSAVQEDWSLHRNGFSEWTATDTLHADGAPVARVRVTGDRDVYQQGLVSFLLVLGGGAVVTGLLLAGGVLLLRTTVTGRLHDLSERVRQVLAAGDLSARVGIEGDDELSLLAQEFDLMLADLERRSSELTRSNVELGAFAGVVSHDLKSPLATFSMNLQLLSKRAEEDGDERQQKQIARMERAVKAMQDRIEAVLEYSRAGREPKKKVVALDDVARNVLEDVEAHLVETGAHVELQPLPSVRGDRQALAQVFQNLVQNAIKYRRPDVPPRIRIRAEEADGGWAVLVADNGRGFEQEDAQKMLQPFQRLANGTDQSGHGIGLATAVRIMAAHDGTLTAFGKPDRGAIMRLWFPKSRVLASPSPGRASLVGGLQKALTTKPDAPAVPSAPPVDPNEPDEPEPVAPAPQVKAEAEETAEAEAGEPETPPEPEPSAGPEPAAPDHDAPERPPRPHPDAPTSRPGTRHPPRGASLTEEERSELEAHLNGPARSQRSSRARRAAGHGPEDGAEPRPADRAR